ncbi:MAG: M10 family metallopeptidase C-terminal domain-containing protein [bacterium]
MSAQTVNLGPELNLGVYDHNSTFDSSVMIYKSFTGRSHDVWADLRLPLTDSDIDALTVPVATHLVAEGSGLTLDSGDILKSSDSHLAKSSGGTSASGSNTTQATSAVAFNDSSYSTQLQALLSDTSWSTANPITYHLQFSDFNGNGTNDWNEDGAATAMRLAFDQWEAVGGITFTEVGTAAEANLVERIGSADGALGYHFFPDTGDFQSEGEYNQNGTGWDSNGLAQGGYGFITMIHELGHGLGLEHPHDTDIFSGIANNGTSGGVTVGSSDSLGDYFLNQGVYTTMSYNDGLAISGGSDSNNYGWQGTPMALDIAAYQIKYGANNNTATGADTYSLANSNASGTYYSSIWDAGGTDEITYSGAKNANIFLDDATIDESPTGGGLLSFVEGVDGGFTIAQNAVIENASSGGGDDFLAGNDVANILSGGTGADVLAGQDGADTLNGDNGNDIIFGDYIDHSVLFAADVAIGGGISLGSGNVSAPQGTNNASLATAIDISSDFSLSANGDITNATTVPHVTVAGVGNNAYDIFAITLNNPFARIVADLDNTSGTFDGMLGIADSSGSVIRVSDDSISTAGAAGSSTDYGVNTSTDSFLAFQPGVAGTYYIVVAQYDAGSLGNITAGNSYDLQVSVEYEYQTAKYSHFAEYFDASSMGGAADTIDGGAGNDDIYAGDGNDSITGGSGADDIDGGDGTDWVRFAASTSGVNANLFNGTGSGGHAAGDTYTNVERLSGSAFADTLTGTDGVNQLQGLDGDDNLLGRSGNDILFGGNGADSLNGGGAIDWAYYTDSTAGVTVNLATNTATGGTAQGDTFTQIERIYGSAFNDNITGDGAGNYLRGGAGTDTLSGGAATDLLSGGTGADALDGGTGLDWAYYIFSNSAVTVDLGANTASGGEATGDSFTSIERVRGSDYDDNIMGNSDNNWFRGGDGADTLQGGTGRDLLQGEGGADTYVFAQGEVFARVRGFEDNTDFLDLTDYGFASQAAAAGFMSNVGASVYFDFGGERVIIENMTVAALQDDILV